MYETFEHTADLGIRIRAPDLNALFAEAGHALFAVIVDDPATIQPVRELKVQIAGDEREYLFFDWLNELLYHWDTEHFLLAACTVSVADAGLEAVVQGEAFDAARHKLGHEVKAITYHALSVVQAADGWEAEVIVDI
jgi:SHS2 domain-containing protein